MLKVLLKKQLREIFRSYFYDAKKNKKRSKASTIMFFAIYVILMVGVLGETALAAVTMANSPFYVMQLMIFGVQSGMSVLVAQYHGRGDQEAINRVMGIAFFVSTTITGLLAITAFCIPEQIMRVLTNNADLVAPGAAYTRYVGFSYFFSAISGV